MRWWEDCCCLPVVRDLKERDASLTSRMSQSVVWAGSWGCRRAVVGGITSKVWQRGGVCLGLLLRHRIMLLLDLDVNFVRAFSQKAPCWSYVTARPRRTQVDLLLAIPSFSQHSIPSQASVTFPMPRSSFKSFSLSFLWLIFNYLSKNCVSKKERILNLLIYVKGLE